MTEKPLVTFADPYSWHSPDDWKTLDKIAKYGHMYRLATWKFIRVVNKAVQLWP